ncbi:MAG: hypothetical protein IT233_11320 [Bacteroidia bacterium]|nr:hypothetical protein [Bacteroidia bacterium]
MLSDFPVISRLFREMEKYDLNYLYNGEFNHDLTGSILSFAESTMDSIGESTRIRKKVYFIMVESLQNITRHSETGQASDETPGFFIIQGINNGYYITSCNKIQKTTAKALRSKLDMVNSLDQDNLKNYSAEILQAGEISKKGGAGLGLIEMARRSGNKLNYYFEDSAGEECDFYFQIKVGPSETVFPVSQEVNFTSAREFFRLMCDRSIQLVYQGNFTQENVRGVLGMIEGKMGEGKSETSRRKVFNLIVELLQNIYKHGDARIATADNARPGIFLIGRKDQRTLLYAGSLIRNEKIAPLKAKIDHVNTFDKEELERFYVAKLMDEDVPGAKGAGLGLIDMRLKCRSSISYDFIRLDDSYSLLTLGLCIPD